MKSIYQYCQHDINACFKGGMILCQFNFTYSLMFGFLTANSIIDETVVAVWKLKSLKNK